MQQENRDRGLAHDPRLDYHDERGRPKYYRVTHNLYGLQSAGAVFYRYAKKWLTAELGFEQSVVDPCIFHKQTEKGLCIVGLYVDDMLVLTPDPAIKSWFMDEFETKFDQSPQGGDQSFLSISYRRQGRKIHLNVPKLWLALDGLVSKHELP